MQKKWAQIQSILEKDLTTGQCLVWLAPLVPAWEEESLILYAPGDFVANFVRARFLSMLAKAAEETFGKACPVYVRCRTVASLQQHAYKQSTHEGKLSEIAISATTPPQAPVHTPQGVEGNMAREVPQKTIPSPRPLPLIQLPLPVQTPEAKALAASDYPWRFSFDDFVVGPCNQLAHAAAHSMCKSTLHTDVLFLSSPPGLGKTHLMQAVGKSMSEACNRQCVRAEYLTAEEFASCFYMSLKTQDTDRFKARYRNLDLLLLEDVHFFQGKEKMQMELLATVKSLRDRGGKAVFTSSFEPRELKQMDEQLQSRLLAGLLSCIDRPDEQTRRRILRHKAARHQTILPEDVEDVLVRHIKTDVRQIESCLQNLILKAQLLNSGITARMAWEVVAHYAAHSPILDMASIILHVCQAFGMSNDQLVSNNRRQECVTARNTAFYLARKHTEMSLAAIGQCFNRKHSTVIKGITNIEREMHNESPSGRQIANTISLIERNGNIVGARH